MPADDPLVALLEAVPEFAPWYLELVVAADDDPGIEVALDAFAEFLNGPDLDGGLALRCAAALEAVAAAAGDDETAEELVGWSCLDAVTDAGLDRLRPHLGPRLRRILATIDR